MDVRRLPFDLEAAINGAAIITRDGREAKFLSFRKGAPEPVRVQVTIKHLHAPMSYFENGYRVLEAPSKHDLFMRGD